MTTVTLRLVGDAGEIKLTNNAVDYLRAAGGGGWGMASVANSFFEGAGDGTVYRSTRRTSRMYDLPIQVFGEGRQAIEDKIRALTRVARDPLRIYADYSDGRSYWIEAVYDSGASGSYSANPEEYAELPFTFNCPDPYWTSVDVQTFKIESGIANYPLIPEIAEVWLGASTAIGKVEINNVGDVPSYPTWRITGPMASGLKIDIDGQGFTLTTALIAAEVITIARFKNGWLVTDQTGSNRYSSLGAAPVFAALPAGKSTVNVVATDTTSASSVVGIFPERREVVY